MALYAIGDLHLCLGAPKPMDIFGGAWVGYMDKLREGLSVIGPDDTTVLLGDLSWALDLENAAADFAWINEIPGFCRVIMIIGGVLLQNSISSAKRMVSPINGFSIIITMNTRIMLFAELAAGFMRKNAAVNTMKRSLA